MLVSATKSEHERGAIDWYCANLMGANLPKIVEGIRNGKSKRSLSSAKT